MHTPKNTKNQTQVNGQSENSEERRNEPVSERKKKQKKKEEMKKNSDELRVIKTKLDAILRKVNRVHEALYVDAEKPNANLGSRHFLQLQLKTIEDAMIEYNAHQQRIYSLNVSDEALEEAEIMYIQFEQQYGKAAGIIDQEIINNNDYAAAWTTLTERFEDKRLIIDKHIDALFDLPKMTSENAADLRRLIDICSKNVDALRNLELPVHGLGKSMLINRIAKKLDDETRKAWELNQSTNEMPDYDITMEFLKERCRVLEKIRHPEKRIVKPVKLLRPNTEFKSKGSSLVATTDKCPQCSNSHELWKCDVFKRANLADRYNTLRRIGACYNCLQRGHRTTECSSEHTCKKCNKRHHTFLHPNETATKKSETFSTVPTSTKDDQQKLNQEVSDSPRSHTNFISEHFATLLRLKKKPANCSIGGLNDMQTKVRFKIHTKLKSRVTDFTTCLELLVIPKITGELPVSKIDSRSLTIPNNIELADPNFGVPDKIDMLLGAEIFFEPLQSGRLQLPNFAAVLQETHFGWVLSGSVPAERPKTTSSFCIRAEEDIDELVKRFGEIETYGVHENVMNQPMTLV
ncbi:uncharacterized protein LOC129732993 [Wyeomyia smithii]|uniref:uncharacterized protein LOC129732993 n=1 Tax=Wyeomyia smithii TaxID=174621 RepID=UPI002467BD47|nr:uncharacterized protein LOC129732993 [Wyeomyia smithii]